MRNLLKRILHEERGAEVTELAIVVALVVAVCGAAIFAVGCDVLLAYRALERSFP